MSGLPITQPRFEPRTSGNKYNVQESQSQSGRGDPAKENFGELGVDGKTPVLEFTPNDHVTILFFATSCL
jgi:hypothetical protein